MGPNYCRPPAPVADEWIDADDPNVTPQGTDYSYWWTVFNDPVLNELVYTAYEQNLPLKIAGLRILEARAQLGVAAGNLFPQQQTFSGTFSRDKISTSAFPFAGASQFILDYFDTWRFGFDAAWELDVWGKFRRAVESSAANLNSQIENYDDVLVILQAEVATNYIQLRALEERLKLARRNVELQKQSLAIAQTRFKIGTVSELDPAQQQAQLANTEALIPVLERQRRLAQNRICTLLGIPPRDLADELGTLPPLVSVPSDVVVGIPADLLRRRPDVRRVEREAAAQSARIGIAEADFYPQISIVGRIGRGEAREFPELWNPASFSGNLTPGFRWNVLNYGRIHNNVSAEEARFQQAVLQYQETVLRASEEVENAIFAFLREQDRKDALARSVQATERSVALSMRQYEQGFIDYVRVLDSQGALVVLQDQLAESRGQVAINLVAVYKALGGGWQMRFYQQPAASTVEQPFNENRMPADTGPTQALPPPPTNGAPAPPRPKPAPSA